MQLGESLHLDCMHTTHQSHLDHTCHHDHSLHTHMPIRPGCLLNARLRTAHTIICPLHTAPRQGFRCQGFLGWHGHRIWHSQGRFQSPTTNEPSRILKTRAKTNTARCSYIVVTNPNIKKVYDSYYHSFNVLRTIPPVRTLEDNARFCQVCVCVCVLLLLLHAP